MLKSMYSDYNLPDKIQSLFSNYAIETMNYRSIYRFLNFYLEGISQHFHNNAFYLNLIEIIQFHPNIKKFLLKTELQIFLLMAIMDLKKIDKYKTISVSSFYKVTINIESFPNLIFKLLDSIMTISQYNELPTELLENVKDDVICF